MRSSLLLPLTLLCACSGVPARGNTVIFASGADLQSPNPLLTVHPLAKQVQRYVLLVTLMRYDSALAPQPYLAQEWRWSADKTVLTLRIFQGLRWHDSVATTAADAAWTLTAALDSLTGYPRRPDLSALRDASAPNDSTLVLRFSRPQLGIPDVLTDLAILPRHLLDTIPLARLRQAEWNRHPVGNGPFRFVSYEANRRWVFEANPDFPLALGGPPRLDRLVIAVVDEPTTKLAALTSGELDFAGINPAHADFVRKNPMLTVLEYPLLFGNALIFNTRRPPFNDLKARHAVATAIDRQAIVDGVLFGFGTPATSPLPPELQGLVRDPGSSLGTIDGPLANPSFELLTVGSGEAALEQMLQAQFSTAGIHMTIRQLELSNYLDRIQGPSHDFDAAVMGLTGDLALGHLTRLVDLSGMTPQVGAEKLLRQIEDSLPAVYIYHSRGVQGMNRRVQGVHMDIRGELVTVSQWWVKQ